MQTAPRQIQIESNLLQRMASSGAHRARAAASSASFDHALRKNRQPEEQLTRPAERAAEPEKTSKGEVGKPGVEAKDRESDSTEPAASDRSPERAEPESESETEPTAPEVEASSAQASAQSSDAHPADGVTNPATLGQAAELVLRGADLRPAQPITIRAFNRRLLDGEAPAHRESGGHTADDQTAEDRAQTSPARLEPGRRGPTTDGASAGLRRAEAEEGPHAADGDPPAGEPAPASRREVSANREAASASADAPKGAEGAAAVRSPVAQSQARTVSSTPPQVMLSARAAQAGVEVQGSPSNPLRSLLSGSAGVAGSDRGARSNVDSKAGSADGEFRRQLVAQVSRGLAGAMVKREGINNNGGAAGASETLVLKLRPEALGQVKVTLEWKDGSSSGQEKAGLSARFEVHSEQTREVLSGAIDELRSSLESRGLSVEDVEVKLVKAALPDPLRALGERPEWDLRPSEAGSVPRDAPETGPGVQGEFAGQQGGGSWQGGGGHWGGLAGGWAAGWTPVPRGALDAAVEMVPGLLGSEAGDGGLAGVYRTNIMTGIDTIA